MNNFKRHYQQKQEITNNIHHAILYGFPENSDDDIITNYKYFINVEKLKDKSKNNNFNIEFLAYLSYLKISLRIENDICRKRNQIHNFFKFNII